MAAEPQSPDTPGAPGGASGTGTNETDPIFETTRWLTPRQLPDELSAKLRVALSQAVSGAQALAGCALVQPLTVRTSEAAPVSPGRLALPAELSDELGPEVETHVVTSDQETHVWLAGLEKLPPGTTLTLAAIGEDEHVVQASIQLDDPSRPVQAVLPSGALSAMAIGIRLPPDTHQGS